ncbi:exonuclease domain-containing protein [Bradyrhizobium sp. SZCCHNRI1002]|uniref:exonuclease domain-containing protein n=1 Tax=Bradyrhizobium sp. SZCCHNRI1002 TaxID=3057274 RepID=UPI0028EAFE2F|nr:exonuclease domain-containing protein [Bradyrhizobium sp. SZCCHNRI1002]
MLLRVIDFECTGLKPPEAAICEIGWTDVRTSESDPAEVGDAQSMLVNPGHPIPPAARGVHHISDRDVRDAPPPGQAVIALMQSGSDGRAPDVFVAHNAAYDQQFFGGGAIPWICTRKVAFRLWPEAPDHKNQTLRYWLNVDAQYEFDSRQAMPSHRAGPDTYVTAHLILKALELTTVEQMIEWTRQPSLLPGAIHFGKHKGTPWSQVDPSYLEWLLKQVDMDPDVKCTARHWLSRRRADDR